MTGQVCDLFHKWGSGKTSPLRQYLRSNYMLGKVALTCSKRYLHISTEGEYHMQISSKIFYWLGILHNHFLKICIYRFLWWRLVPFSPSKVIYLVEFHMSGGHSPGMLRHWIRGSPGIAVKVVWTYMDLFVGKWANFWSSSESIYEKSTAVLESKMKQMHEVSHLQIKAR